MSKHEVGYGKPPKEHQFKKGQPAANPKGRPKGRKSKSILDKLDEKVVVDTRNGRRVKKTLREVLDHHLVKDALAGDKHARSLIYRYREAAEKVDVTPKSVAVENDQQTSLEGSQPPYTIPATPEERRQAFKIILEKALGKIYQNIDEAIELAYSRWMASASSSPRGPAVPPKGSAWCRSLRFQTACRQLEFSASEPGDRYRGATEIGRKRLGCFRTECCKPAVTSADATGANGAGTTLHHRAERDACSNAIKTPLAIASTHPLAKIGRSPTAGGDFA